MKVNILHKLKNNPWGGGNQFLKAISNEFIKMNVYEDNPEKADIILFNSFPSSEEYLFNYVKNLKNKGKILIHRIDGPIFFIRQKDLKTDRIIYKFNNFFADGTIFQSEWSKKKNEKLGIKKNKFETTIINAPNPEIFNRDGKIVFSKERKIKIICTSWSDNMRKGFDIYKYLDHNLDFSKYEMVFCGNSPIEFKNIKKLKPLPTEELALELKNNDIFITASRSDPCSNSLIEALHCGLPAVALKDGGHPEIVKEGGVLFTGENDVITAIQKVVQNYNHYQKQISTPDMEYIAFEYYNFAKDIYSSYNSSKYQLKKINFLKNIIFFLNFFIYKARKKIARIKKKV